MRMNCFDRRTLMVLSLTLSSGFSKSSAIVRPAEPALSWITLRIREALRGGRHEREIGTKRYCRTLLGPKIYWLPKFIRRNPKTSISHMSIQ